jgi:hypothetical protein
MDTLTPPVPETTAPVETKIEYWTTRDEWIMAPKNHDAKQKLKDLLTANPQDLMASGGHARWPEQPALGRLAQIKKPTQLILGEADIPDWHTHIRALQAWNCRIEESGPG